MCKVSPTDTPSQLEKIANFSKEAYGEEFARRKAKHYEDRLMQASILFKETETVESISIFIDPAQSKILDQSGIRREGLKG